MIGYRKFSIMFLILAITSILTVAEYVTGAGYVDLLKVVGVAFMGANLVENWKKQ